MLLVGRKISYRITEQSTAHCQRCGGDRPFRRRAGRGWFNVLGMPLIPLAATGDHVQCAICRTCYRIDLLAVPTTAQMEEALVTGAKSSACAMLVAGRPTTLARKVAISIIQDAGAPDYDEVQLAGDIAAAAQRVGQGADVLADGELEAAMRALALQLEPYAREWFLANVVRIGLADGPLTIGERQAVRAIAGYFGMTQAQAQDVIWLTEEAAPAG